ncbi:pseudouridine synthase [Aquabacterium sp. A08]|uniref:pseudouridine synthase n=1 Tax=Aquabacterium sp. A08 TaxID=2718532 RepID=UPI00141EE889|nr:pseudouridine synthase [Aquabacterium sp. A08]NIC43436.1 pseudouridine synthase [Aquabacterium sp. A08]
MNDLPDTDPTLPEGPAGTERPMAGTVSAPDEALFAQVVSGEFDAQQSVEAPPVGKRVLQPQADAPKLHKVLAQAGLGSRLEMEQMILEGRISVNGEPAHVGQRIQYGDSIKVNGKPIRVRIAPPPPRVLAYHKPAGEVVTHDDPQNRPTVFRRLPRLYSGKWQSVGRLDLNTEGLLLFTDSGELANKLMHPRFGLQREYAVRVLGALSNDEKDRLLEGVRLDDGMAQFQSIEDGGGDGANCWYRVTIAEGRNREVRRMFEAVGHAVSRLIRIRYGAVMLPRGLRRGVWMELDHRDIERLTSAAGMVTPSEAAAARPARPAPRNPSRRKGQGPRPSAPKLVDGPPVPRHPGAKRPMRLGAEGEGGQPDPMKTSYGYIGADAQPPRGRPGGGAGGPRRGGPGGSRGRKPGRGG